MNIVEINITYGIGSTGRIVRDLANRFEELNWNCYTVAGYSLDNANRNVFSLFNNYPSSDKINTIINRISGKTGYRQKKKTAVAVEWMNEKKPDLIHLHNIHGDWINIKYLFEYIKENRIPVIWTLHDCWAFTGRCSHFELNGCEKWKTGCFSCKYKNVYPCTYFADHSKKMWRDKYDLFRGIDNLILVTPSHWLSGYVKHSFLSEYDTKVIHNGINTDVFKLKAQEKKSNVKYILGAANSWSKTKGLDDFISLDKIIDHNKYKIVLVGLNETQMKTVPDSIDKLPRTNSPAELAELYNIADYYVNFTYQDNFPTTNLEALCCGCPVITYDTGGSPESVSAIDGYVIEKGCFKKAYEIIESTNVRSENERRDRAERASKVFSVENSCRAYSDLAEEMMMR